MADTLVRGINFKVADFWILSTDNLTAQSFGGQLVAEADAEKRQLKFPDGMEDHQLLLSQPRIILLLPYMHGSTHDPQTVKFSRIGNGVIGVQVNFMESDVEVGGKLPENPRVLGSHVLDDEYRSH